jgi:hypothetical protein
VKFLETRRRHLIQPHQRPENPQAIQKFRNPELLNPEFLNSGIHEFRMSEIQQIQEFWNS